MNFTREQRRQLERDNKKHSLTLEEIPQNSWPSLPNGLLRVWRSRNFLAQLYCPEQDGFPLRLSISRVSFNPVTGRWDDEISWEDLMQIKREAGFGSRDAVEIFPADRDVVNVANMRHLFLMDEPISFAWRKSENIKFQNAENTGTRTKKYEF